MTQEIYQNLTAKQQERFYGLIKEAYDMLGGDGVNMYDGGSIADYTSRVMQYVNFERTFALVRGAMLEAVRDYTHITKKNVVTIRTRIPHDDYWRIVWGEPWRTIYRIGGKFYTCTMVVNKGVPEGQPEVHESTDDELKWIVK